MPGNRNNAHRPLRSAADWFLVAVIGAVVLIARPAHSAGPCTIGITDYVCTTLSFPGASSTRATGINNAGQVTGHYELLGTHAYSYVSSTYSAISDPSGAAAVYAFDIGDSGRIVGYTLDSSGYRGFVKDGGSYAAIAYPGAVNTYAFGTNSAGQVVGAYEDSTGTARGFVLGGGTFSSVSVPASTATYLYGVNDSGVLAGTYVDNSGSIAGFTLSNGQYSTVNAPGATQTFVRGLNSWGDLVGEYVTVLGKTAGFVRLGSGDFWTFDILGATRTFANAINDAGVIAGYYQLDGSYQSFIALPTPVALPASMPLFAAGLMSLLALRRRSAAT